jgi:hypothetical protein
MDCLTVCFSPVVSDSIGFVMSSSGAQGQVFASQSQWQAAERQGRGGDF